MEDRDIAARLQSGGTMTGIGIFVLVASFFGTCVAAAAEPDNPARGLEIGESPWLLIGLTVGIALIAVGQARKANARRDAEAQLRDLHTSHVVVPDPDVAGGPFRGAVKQVPVVDPQFVAIEEAARERDHQRGVRYLWIGGIIMAVTIVGVVLGMGGGDYAYERMRKAMTAVGLGVFPFGLGMFFAIKGAVLRSK
jgi:hypothetical protein